MTRTNIDIDDELIVTVMSQNGISTKREAVDVALRNMVRHVATTDELLALRGTGFALDNDEVEGDDEVDQWRS